MSQINLPTHYYAMAVTQFGGPEVLQPTRLAMPVIGTGQVLIKLLATSINPIDYKTRAGLGWAAQQNKNNLPFVLGYDCFGAVVATADNVSTLDIGNKVIALASFPLGAGAYGEYVLLNSDEVVKVTDSFTNAAAALPVAGLSAHQGLFEFGALSRGETVVISGAGGGVGYIAVQLALNAGARVIAIAHAKDHQRLADLGNVECIDYTQPALFDSLSDIDLWFDLIGGESACQQLAQVNGVKRLVTLPTITADLVCNAVKSSSTSAQGMLISANVEILRKLTLMVENGQLKLNIAKYMNYQQAASAHQQLETGELKGKVILEFNQ